MAQVVDSNGMTCLHLAAITTAQLTQHARELREAANISHSITKKIMLEKEREDNEGNGNPRTKSPGAMLLGMISSHHKSGGKDKVVAASEKESKKAEKKASEMEKLAREATRYIKHD